MAVSAALPLEASCPASRSRIDDLTHFPGPFLEGEGSVQFYSPYGSELGGSNCNKFGGRDDIGQSKVFSACFRVRHVAPF